jgi:DNA-binding MarR family transcriptional regulator
MSVNLDKTFEDWMNLNMRNSLGNFMRFAKERNYSISQLSALIHLAHHKECTVSGLGEEFGVTNAAISQVLEKLVQLGLVLRTEDPQDRRQKVLVLTDEGKKIAGESQLERQKWLSDLINNLTEQEKEQVDSALRLLINKATSIYGLNF